MKNFLDKSKDYIAIVLVILIIFVLGYIYGNIKDRNTIKTFFGKEIQYDFLSPLLTCPESKYIQNSKNLNLETKLSYLSEVVSPNTGINHISLYFRDLNNGYRFGINEKELFTPASLTKVPTLIAILKRSESEKGFLDQKVKYTLPQIDYKTHYKPKYQAESNQIYSIRQLLEYMIKYSDNNATQILRDILGKNRFGETYSNLGISSSDLTNIKVIDYAGFFRVIYNASYLNKTNSEFALNLLSQVDFKNGLPSGIPESIKIAHKFGEYSINGTTSQLHDCGIVYYPNHPYLLCIMTRGNSNSELEKLISETSQKVFTEINNIYQEIK